MRQRSEPLVGVVMGSDSDWPVHGGRGRSRSTEFDVPYEVDVVSAHRMPREMLDYGVRRADRGLRVLIAGAGGAAHLPGMLASVTPLPGDRRPVPLENLDGLDSLLSIVQMPAGVPVATVSGRRAPATPACWPCASSRRPTRRCARADGGVPGRARRGGRGQGRQAAPTPRRCSRRGVLPHTGLTRRLTRGRAAVPRSRDNGPSPRPVRQPRPGRRPRRRRRRAASTPRVRRWRWPRP